MRGTFSPEFDAENRLASVRTGNQTTSFYYDADGNRILTVLPNSTKVYTPFPEYEESVPTSGPTTQRSSYFLAGQLMAVRVRTGTSGDGALYFAYTDHLGNVAVWTYSGGTLVANSLARYDPYGNYRTEPGTNANPDISDRGFTSHRMNNTGAYDLGLIYMNARYYLPEVGRFISADSIVPEPKDPQTYNRYTYALNSPTNFTDPSGHCTSNYEIGSQDMETCLSAWTAVANYLSGAAFGPGGSGHFPNELVSDWLANADIGTLENLMDVFGIGYGYTFTPPQGYSSHVPSGAKNLGSPEARAELCQYWQSCYSPPAEYSSIGGNVFIGARVIWDRWDNVYVYFHLSGAPGVSVTAGNIRVSENGEPKEIESLAIDEQEAATEAFLNGTSDGGCGSMGVAACIVGNSAGNYAVEGGFAFPPGLSTDVGYGAMLYNANAPNPWFWQQWFK